LPARAVSDSTELLSVVTQGHARGVILDPMLPGNAGYGALVRIRAIAGAAASVPVLVLSTNDAPEHMETAKRLGSTDYAVKGRETPTQLVLRMRRLMGAAKPEPYYVTIRADQLDAQRLASDIQAPGLRCSHCREPLCLALEGDPASNGYALTCTFACRRCMRLAKQTITRQENREVA
jgi:DNA-binding response OmpR family regulator